MILSFLTKFVLAYFESIIQQLQHQKIIYFQIFFYYSRVCPSRLGSQLKGLPFHQWYTSLSQHQLLNIIVMFCCSPQHMELAIVKTELDFENAQLYSHKFTEILKTGSTKHTLSKLSSLKIDSKNNYEFKHGHDKHSQFLFQLCDASKEVQLTSLNTNKHSENIWRILSQNQAHKLCIGDKIKIGFTQLMVYSQRICEQQIKESVQLNSSQHCRYCLLNTFTAQDPLVSLCRCSGSVRYLHLSCLRNWAMMKMQEQDRGHIKVFTISKLQCELCRTPWPKRVLVQGKYQGLLTFQSSSKLEESFIVNNDPYLVFETDTLDEDELQIIIFIKIFLNDKFYFGDSEETSDLAIETIGVSPMHCYIHVENDHFYITDCGSTTGTLVTMHEEEIFTNKSSLFMQYNRHFIRIGLEEPFFACFVPEQQYHLRYKVVYMETKQ